MRPLRVVGMDPSLRHWGLASGVLEVDLSVTLSSVHVIEPVLHTGKQVRQNSEDLEAAEQLYQQAYEAARYADAVFVEVPVGSQNARAMASYGVCIGVLAALRAGGIPIFQVTASEVKRASGCGQEATKRQMIAWATKVHGDITWPMQTKKGVTSIVEGKAEHMADAVGAIYAGKELLAFKQLLKLSIPSHPMLPSPAATTLSPTH